MIGWEERAADCDWLGRGAADCDWLLQPIAPHQEQKRRYDMEWTWRMDNSSRGHTFQFAFLNPPPGLEGGQTVQAPAQLSQPLLAPQ